MGRALLVIAALGLAGLPMASWAQDDDEAPTFTCYIRDAMIFADRTQVRCHNPSPEGFRYFAVDTQQPFSTAVVMRTLQALRSRAPVELTYAPDAELNPPGCSQRSCRRIINVVP